MRCEDLLWSNLLYVAHRGQTAYLNYDISTHSSHSRIAGVRISTIFYQIYPSLSVMPLCSPRQF